MGATGKVLAGGAVASSLMGWKRAAAASSGEGITAGSGAATTGIWYYVNGSSYRTTADLEEFCKTAGTTYVAP